MWNNSPRATATPWYGAPVLRPTRTPQRPGTTVRAAPEAGELLCECVAASMHLAATVRIYTRMQCRKYAARARHRPGGGTEVSDLSFHGLRRQEPAPGEPHGPLGHDGQSNGRMKPSSLPGCGDRTDGDSGCAEAGGSGTVADDGDSLPAPKIGAYGRMNPSSLRGGNGGGAGGVAVADQAPSS